MIRTKQTSELKEAFEEGFDSGYVQGIEHCALVSLGTLHSIRGSLSDILVPGDESAMNTLLDNLEREVLQVLAVSKR